VTVPPDARCVRDGCEAEGVDPLHPAPLCQEHLPEELAEAREVVA
jgi:hypothetical protein